MCSSCDETFIFIQKFTFENQLDNMKVTIVSYLNEYDYSVLEEDHEDEADAALSEAQLFYMHGQR